MIKRNALAGLSAWRKSANRKPLIIRGARQVGKSTLVEMFAKQFRQFIYLNLDTIEDRELFAEERPFKQIIDAIFFSRNAAKDYKNTLLFIDEIQSSPFAMKQLRYFYEKAPKLAVIAAGSLFEAVVRDFSGSFPVGRVEFMYLHPLSFSEYLTAINEPLTLESYNSTPVPVYAHQKLLSLYHEFTLLGGFPEIVNHWVQHRDLSALQKIYQALQESYMNDIEKYASNDTVRQMISRILHLVPFYSGQRITMNNFGQSGYSGREVKNVLDVLQNSMLIQIIYPSTRTEMPLEPDFRKAPRLQFIDTGLMNYRMGIQDSYFSLDNLSDIYKGKILEHQIGCALINRDTNYLGNIRFWVRHKNQSHAEIDFLLQHKGELLPVEVKSGKSGRLRSLHSFMDRSSVKYAVRLWNKPVKNDEVRTISGKRFVLINLPYYLAEQIEKHYEWALSQVVAPLNTTATD
ncbi:MAG: AAA family ATPase [Candidatus Cloacimonetes bacterium]|nr:AAA family ATPase [Candidatus Cloacimonadota bacterium]